MGEGNTLSITEGRQRRRQTNRGSVIGVTSAALHLTQITFVPSLTSGRERDEPLKGDRGRCYVVEETKKDKSRYCTQVIDWTHVA